MLYMRCDCLPCIYKDHTSREAYVYMPPISLLNSVYSYQIRIMSQGQVRRHDGWFDYVKRYKGGLWLVLGVKLNNACPPCKQYATLDCARIEHSYLLITSHDTILPYYG